ncbi:MAG: hypothetical protein QOG83_2511, partial [Alphaproteobacteria bacterium]|nr:hypothetical protein [Alphaproteobacteria bacterium]
MRGTTRMTVPDFATLHPGYASGLLVRRTNLVIPESA